MTLDPFLLRAGLAGLGLALAAAPLGCFVVWRRMAYFGDATAHGALMGVALALALSLPVWVGVVAVSGLMGLSLLRLTARGDSADVTLGVLSHGALALGLVALSLAPGRAISLEALLFGDILSVNWRDVALIWAGGAVVAGVVAWRWSGLLIATLDPDLARADGIAPDREQAILVAALALTVAFGLKVVGALLIGAMLVIPPATARPLARTPEAMAALTGAAAAAAVIAGLGLSLWRDWPAGPAIVCAALGLFALSRLAGLRAAA
ncbi:hypothetical protein E2L08_03555 [Palleronia sediminis]|uniref:High-affinity zinc uptake system membrane protein ZnuB n=1 Tax=Palleronia sediminis TaxID=2547833 RepID=A0A4R6AP23_9RHOB|nr:metal ABC transporter permease [Palleronia sediminis]TDL83726.1 hypothetical protein E2L08_03555 [Palleronia sediminis]